MGKAIAVASRIISQFPNAEKANDGFTHAIALVLSDYPAKVAYSCADPKVGVASEKEFLSIAAIAAWCERRLILVDKLARPNIPLQKSKPYTPPPIKSGQITYTKFLENCEKDGKKPRPIGAFEAGGYLGPSK